MNDDSTLDEFCEDFGAPPLSSAELDALMERARLTSDVQLDRLVKEAQLHRWLLPQLLERAEQISVGSEDQLIKLARFFVRGGFMSNLIPRDRLSPTSASFFNGLKDSARSLMSPVLLFRSIKVDRCVRRPTKPYSWRRDSMFLK